jgi:hypothetical protein
MHELVEIGRVEARRSADARIERASKREVPADADTERADRSVAVVT